MSLFSNRKKNKSSKQTAERKNILTLKCPECGFEQTESNMAVSTYCRSCNAHYKISNGEALPNKESPNTPFAALKDSSQSPKLRSSSDDTEAAATEEKPNKRISDTPKFKTTESKVAATPSKKTKPAPPNLIKKAAASTGLFKEKEKEREVRCFDCNKVHKALIEASSTQCPACGLYIALKDYEIESSWNGRIKTRGNVIIQKKATVAGITIQCHDLTSYGTFTGGVDCSGDFIVRSNGKIMGTVQCNRLIIEKRSKVEFANTVQCKDAIIDGTVTGNFECSGKLALQKKATLTGDIRVATMSVEEGAKHNGRISIGQ